MMFHELFGSGVPLIGASGERNPIAIGNGGIILEGAPAATPSSSPSPLASPDPSSPATVTTKGGGSTAAGKNGAEGQNLRCPRCDSSNTKFCYYNNYNLTQPRHFCKTCRRYWTKGGALRNVPIGGGCRKNRTSSVSSAVAKPGATKFKSLTSAGFTGALDSELSSNPVMWASPHTSHILALLRGTPINPNPSPNPISPLLKEGMNTFGAHLLMGTDHSGMASAGTMSSHGLGFEPLNHLPSIGLSSSFWRNGGAPPQHQPPTALQLNQANHQNGHVLAEAPNTNSIQALYQKLKLSTGEYSSEWWSPPASKGSDHGTVATSTSKSPFVESGPMGVTGSDQLGGYWPSSNPSLCWSDISQSNGAYP